MPASVDFFGQVFEWHDFAVVGLLVVLEGMLSIDNALVLGLLAKRLPKHQQPGALNYGLVGAFVFRALAIATAGLLLKWRIVKLLGGGYLVYIAAKHLFFESQEEVEEKFTVSPEGQPVLVDARTGAELTPEQRELEIKERVLVDVPAGEEAETGRARFWPTVFVIALTDIAFAVDSILAAIALVGSGPSDHPANTFHPKLWLVVVGGGLGIVLIRFAAVIFISLLERFPRFEDAAYYLVTVIGGKLLIDWYFNTPDHPHQVDFHDWRHPAFWTFWALMVVCFCAGFLPSKRRGAQNT